MLSGFALFGQVANRLRTVQRMHILLSRAKHKAVPRQNREQRAEDARISRQADEQRPEAARPQLKCAG